MSRDDKVTLWLTALALACTALVGWMIWYLDVIADGLTK